MPRPITSLLSGALPAWTWVAVIFVGMQIGASGQGQVDPDGTSVVAGEPIRRVMDFWSLSPEERGRPRPIELELSVLYNDPMWGVVQVRDSSAFEYMELTPAISAQAGDVVRLKGVTAGNPYTFALEVKEWVVTDNRPLEAEEVVLSELNHAAMADHLVAIAGFVEHQFMEDENHLTIEMVVDGHRVRVVLLMDPAEPVPQWEGGILRVKGVYAPKVNAQGQVTLIEMWCPGTDFVEWVDSLAGNRQFERPVSLIGSFVGRNAAELALVRGEYVGESRDGEMLVRDESGQLAVTTARQQRPEVGEMIEVLGMTYAASVDVRMTRALWRPHVVSEQQRAESDAPLPFHRVAASIRELSPLQAAMGQPARITGVVTWSDPDRQILYLQDSSSGIAVRWDPSENDIPEAGKLIALEGVTAAGNFAPFVAATKWEEVAAVERPTARAITRDQAMTGLEEAQLVELIGFVFRSEALDGELRLDVSTSSGEMVVRVANESDETRWLGALVKATGVCVAQADDARRLVAAEIWVADASGIEVLQGGLDDPFMRPLTPMRDLGRFNPNAILRDRLRLEGTVVWVEDSGEIWISEGGVTLPIHTRQASRPREGERIEVVGFLGMNVGQRILREAVWRSVGLGDILMPSNLASPNAPLEHGAFTTVRGEVQAVSGRAGRVSMVLSTPYHPAFVVEIDDSNPEQVRIHAPLGSVVDVSGLVLRSTDRAPGAAELRLMVYEIGDVRTVKFPPWWTRERLIVFVILTILLVMAALLWVTSLRRIVRKQTAQINEQNSRAREMQAELDRTQRLESMGSMAEGITQDFEQLLQRIHFQVGEALNRERLSWETRNRLDQAQAAVLRAQDLTRRLASFSLTGRSVPTSVEWGDFLQREIESFEFGPTVKIIEDLPSHGTSTRIDTAQMRQVIRALLRNAVQAMPHGGSIKISVDQDQVKTGDSMRLLATGKYLRTRVADTGHGIAAEALNRVFDPYFTQKNETKGLGLAVAYAVIRQHKGRIEIDSTEGTGTTVTMWLPCSNSEATPVGPDRG